MSKSIIQTEKECLICRTTYNLHLHHCIHGSGRRKLSDKYGLVVWLCARHHNMSDDSVHHNHDLDMEVKKLAQKKFEDIHGHDKFMKVFGRNYL